MLAASPAAVSTCRVEPPPNRPVVGVRISSVGTEPAARAAAARPTPSSTSAAPLALGAAPPLSFAPSSWPLPSSAPVSEGLAPSFAGVSRAAATTAVCAATAGASVLRVRRSVQPARRMESCGCGESSAAPTGSSAASKRCSQPARVRTPSSGTHEPLPSSDGSRRERGPSLTTLDMFMAAGGGGSTAACRLRPAAWPNAVHSSLPSSWSMAAPAASADAVSASSRGLSACVHRARARWQPSEWTTSESASSRQASPSSAAHPAHASCTADSHACTCRSSSQGHASPLPPPPPLLTRPFATGFAVATPWWRRVLACASAPATLRSSRWRAIRLAMRRDVRCAALAESAAREGAASD
mmetsp:Transcript_29038/g.74677  ORF Transcript_29038/g.74677 Transcript_29038/m.74677 type:complete len:356 (+) Transcript_29038:700-1767(+)